MKRVKYLSDLACYMRMRHIEAWSYILENNELFKSKAKQKSHEI